MSHLRAPDGTVLCEHEDAHDALHALLERPANALPDRDGQEHGDEAHDHSHGLVDRSTAYDLEAMYRLLAIAKYEERYVIPKAHGELASQLMEQQGACGLDFDGGPGNCGAVQPRANERFMLTKSLPLLGENKA